MRRELNRVWLTLAMILITLTSQAQLKSIVFTPQWDANAQFAGYIAARELGYYEFEGLKVILKKQEATPGKVSYQLRQPQFDHAASIMKAAGLIETIPDFKTFIR